jgi:hypothetical protein
MKMMLACTVSTLAILIGMNTATAQDENARRLQYTSGTAEAAQEWQRELRRELFEALSMSDLAGQIGKIPLEPKVLSEEKRDGCRVREIRVNSTPTRTMTIMVAQPLETPANPMPGVVGIHGHGGDRTSPFDPDERIFQRYKRFGTKLAKKGYTVVSTDVGQHDVFEKGRSLMGERLWDVMRCVDYLVSLPEVDAARLGCGGLSLGGEMAMWLGGMDTRVQATVSCGFLTTMDHMEQNHCMCWKFPGLRELADYADIYALTAPRALQCQNGMKESERNFYVPLARETLQEILPAYRDTGAPDAAVLHVHPGGHEIDGEALIAFLDKYLEKTSEK